VLEHVVRAVGLPVPDTGTDTGVDIGTDDVRQAGRQACASSAKTHHTTPQQQSSEAVQADNKVAG
jgi:hypothetical protein